jgi:hypothetical protein
MKKVISAILGIAILQIPSFAAAQTPSSSNYSVPESSFSSGSNTESTSASFSAQGSAGDLGVGLANSGSYRAYAGPISPNEEYLELGVTLATINLDTPSGDPGILDLAETAYGFSTFYVRAYLNSSYAVQTISEPLTNESGDTIEPITTAAASVPGTEQFGINIVDNANPNVGSNPAPDPNASFANGAGAAGYSTADQYQYNNGDIIAQNSGNPAWGQTNFTISYIANISPITEAGLYTMQHQLVAISTF